MSILFTGNSGNYVKVDYASTIQNDTDQFSIGCWIKYAAWVNYGKVIIRENTGAGSREYYLLYSNDGSGGDKPRAYFRNASDTAALADSSTSVSTGTWVHICAVYNGSTLKFYLNGSETASSSLSGNLKNDTSNPIYIGYDPTSPSSAGINARIADLFIIKEALSTSYITQLQSYYFNKESDSNCILYLPCTESSGITDNSSYAHTLTETGTLTYDTGDNPPLSVYSPGGIYPFWANNTQVSTGGI